MTAVLPSIDSRQLALTQDPVLQHSLVKVVQALMQSAPAAAAQHAEPLLMMLLQIRSGLLLTAHLPVTQVHEVTATGIRATQ